MTENIYRAALEKYPTPLYVFDEKTFAQTVEHIRAALPRDTGLCFAMKANPFLVRSASACVERIEVCSTGEMRICQHEGVPMEKVLVSGVHKDADLMRELMAGRPGVCRYTVESVLQYEMLECTARELGVRVPILIRLTSGNQFGVDAATLRVLAERAAKSDVLTLCGIHYFPGTQRTSAKRLRRELERVDRLMVDLQGELDVELTEFEYGAGLPVEYFESDAEAARRSEDEQLAVLGEALGTLRFGGRTVVELGRALAAASGVYATRVVDIKKNGGHNFAIVDGGMHQLVYYGHAMSLQQPVCRVLSDGQDGDEELWSFYGSLCTTNDVLAKQIPCRGVHVGDVVLFEKTGAYCMTEGISLFLSRDLPRIVVADRDGTLELARDRVETHALNTWMH